MIYISVVILWLSLCFGVDLDMIISDLFKGGVSFKYRKLTQSFLIHTNFNLGFFNENSQFHKKARAYIISKWKEEKKVGF